MPRFMTALRAASLSSVDSGSRPRVVAGDRTGHAAGAATAADELTPLEGDDRPLGVGDLLFTRKEGHRRNDGESHLLHLPQRAFVPRVGRDEPGTHRGEVASGRPLLAFLDRAPVPADEDGLEGEATQT